ncbi:MAG: M20/M25/M40 family metallo-hydrolase [Bacteroidales bacterium]|nr:M20/M25/M40 family metallo-hydrolase [Bacteroidales bacterium]
MERLKNFIIITTIISLSFTDIFGQNFEIDHLKKHIHFLASNKLEGRSPGTEGEKLAYEYIQQQFIEAGLIAKGDSGFFQPFEYEKRVNPHDTIKREKIEKKGINVVGFLDNGAPTTIVIGAHYDHLGYGRSPKKHSRKYIHNGADDNASGTAGVLELAQYFGRNNKKENNNLLFICFSAEEDGLIGSKYFTAHPTIDLTQVNFMFNMDMIGRFDNTSKKLMVNGIGTSPGYAGIFTSTQNITPVTDSSGSGASDHTSFYQKNIPVIHFFTGQHKDYHKPTDDANKINYEGLQLVLQYIATKVEDLDNADKLSFTPTKQKDRQRSEFRVTLGIMPDYTYTGKGLRVDAVTDGKPAQNAGMKNGDIIQAINDQPVNDIYAYMQQLSKLEKGNTIKVSVLRKNDLLNLNVKL